MLTFLKQVIDVVSQPGRGLPSPQDKAFAVFTERFGDFKPPENGPDWEAVADGAGHDKGWPLYLERYAALFIQRS